MSEHVYDKADLINRFDSILGKQLGEIDTIGMFEHVQSFNLQKGVAGAVIEQCVLGYESDTKQEADLLVVEGDASVKVELKTTGMVINDEPREHYVAKEPMSITAVGIYDIADQEFYTSHFWEKLEHMLIVYYHYASKHAVTPYEYRVFPIKGYEFHEFDIEEVQALRHDWECVKSLIEKVIAAHPGPRDKDWKTAVKEEYIDVHGELRRELSYIDLAPKFPPRFRLKKPIVSTMIAKHFGYQLEQLPGKYTVISDVDCKLHELAALYGGMTVADIADEFGISTVSANGKEKKGITEQLIISMFGGTSKKLNQIEMFERFGLIAKTIVMTDKGGRTEDMKLFHIDFEEVTRKEIIDDDGNVRPIEFEDSDLYSYFADQEFLCLVFKEPSSVLAETLNGVDFTLDMNHRLADNIFIGFKRLVFDDEFIDTTVRKLWDDLRDKILNNKLVDIVQKKRDGTVIINKSGGISSAPNFMKSSENRVFVRGGATDATCKTECVNGIKMLPQYVWIKGTAVIEEIKDIPFL